MQPLSYVVPLAAARPDTALFAHLATLVDVAEVIVVDGSPPEVAAAHASLLPAGVRHLRPPAERRTPNGKVGNVLVGVEAASHEHVVIADDDVRWTAVQLERASELLEGCDVVRPQNWFHPLPWHARWDTGRILIHRALGGDWPGTLAVRRSVLLRTGGYDGGVLFENLELVRTVVAAGGRECVALDLLVRRVPPPTGHFLRQRVRQAYDEMARPARLVASLAVLPALAATRRRGLVALAAGSVAVAEAGRRRARGREVFGATAALWAPAWVLERAVTCWLAVGSRLVLGGVRYRGGVLRRAATPMRELRRRHGIAPDPAVLPSWSARGEPARSCP